MIPCLVTATDEGRARLVDQAQGILAGVMAKLGLLDRRKKQ